MQKVMATLLLLALLLPAVAQAQTPTSWCVQNWSEVASRYGGDGDPDLGFSPGSGPDPEVDPESGAPASMPTPSGYSRWVSDVGGHSGAIIGAPDSCVREPGRLGTLVYHLDAMPAKQMEVQPSPGTLTEHSAVVIYGPAHIRSGPSIDSSSLGFCLEGSPLTVWTPGSNGYLMASCYHRNGWIHDSTVQIPE